jgi:hypothetical protein
MDAIKILEEETPIGVIPIYDGSKSLFDLHQEIEDFNLMHGDVVVDTTDEQDMAISTAGSYVDTDVGHGRFLLINIKSIKNIADRLHSQSTSSIQDPDPSPMKKPKTGSFLRSPMSWEIRGVKVYSEYEIFHSKGMEKQ